MAMQANVEAVWFAKQTAQGTAALYNATGVKRGRKVGGDISTARDDGSENYSDGQRFSSASDYVNTVNGSGNPTLQASPEIAGLLFSLSLGADAVGTAVSGVYPHTITPAGNSQWFTAWKEVGSASGGGQIRQRFEDCKMTSLRFEMSSASKTAKLTPTFTSLKPGRVYDATNVPTATISADEPFLWTEATGTFKINGAGNLAGASVIGTISGLAFTINDTVSPWYGDDIFPKDVTYGRGSINIEGLTVLVDTTGLALYNQIMYGTSTPTLGQAPTSTIPATGAFEFTLSRGATTTARSLKVQFPNVKWTSDLAIAGNVDGGAVELALGAETRSGNNHISVLVNTTDSTSYTA
jgi:hypothetical protein